MDSSRIYVKLVALRNQSGSLLYQRLTLAAKLLSDREWVGSKEGGGGDEGVALDRLETECFADVCGAMSLPEMLGIIAAVPEEETWKANKYNLRRMHAEKRERSMPQKPRKASDPVPSGTTTDDYVNPVGKLRNELREALEEIKALKRENHQLRSALERIQRIIPAIAG